MVPELSDWRRQKLPRAEERQCAVVWPASDSACYFVQFVKSSVISLHNLYVLKYALCMMQHSSKKAVQPPTVHPPPLVMKM